MSIYSLCKKLNLPEPGRFSQDWEYEVADSHRIDEFIDAYHNDKSLTENERFTLFIIITGSLNDALTDGLSVDREQDLYIDIARKHRSQHKHTLEYWSCAEEPSLENCFAVTPLIRSLLSTRDR